VPTRDRQELGKKASFAKAWLRKSLAEREKVCFSDETWLCTNERTGRVQWVPKDVHPIPCEKKLRWNTSSIMVWCAIGVNYKSPMCILPAKRKNADDEVVPYRLDSPHYIRTCLSPSIKDLISRDMTFMQDGARAHVAKATLAYLRKKCVRWIKNWPPYSCDLNCIEPLWKELAERVGRKHPQGLEELKKAAREAWAEMPMSMINAHVRHFTNALKNVTKGEL